MGASRPSEGVGWRSRRGADEFGSISARSNDWCCQPAIFEEEGESNIHESDCAEMSEWWVWRWWKRSSSWQVTGCSRWLEGEWVSRLLALL